MEVILEEAKAEIETLKSSLEEKESIIKQLSSTNESQRAEAESLKAVVSELQKRCSGAEKDTRCEGGDLVEELEDRRRKVEDELKWKVEQFKHLEEAHQKLRDQFNASKSEWEKEKTSLIDEITKLQESLDQGNLTAEGMKNQLVMCKQVLESEESRRNKLEEEVSKMKSLLESATIGGFEAKIGEECTAVETGEQELANLRHSLRVKEMDYKDLEYKAKKLEKENQELLTSIKELQEAHIPRAVPTPSSWTRLKNRLKSLEQSHRECSASLRAKEADWSCKSERMAQELKRCKSNLKMKDQVIEELKKEIEGCNSSLTQLKMQNEELSLMLQLMKSESSEDKESGVAHFMEQLEKEREGKVALQEELEKLREELEEVREALDMVDADLTDTTNERSELEFKLQNWKSLVEHMEMQVTGCQTVRKELELSLLAQAEVEEMLKQETEEKERRISNLEQQIYLMDQEIRIGEEDDPTVDYEKVSQRLQMDDGEQLQLELLAKELEDAIVNHMMGERNYKFGQISEEDNTRIDHEGEEVSGSKENVNQEHSDLRKTSESNIKDRSPFRELN